MSADIVVVLVIASKGDPGGLLCWHQELGGGPPTAVLSPGGWIGSYSALRGNAIAQWAGDEPLLEIVEAQHALVLWWDSALVPDGWDRARRVYLHWCTSNDRQHEREPHFGTAQQADPDFWEVVDRVGQELVRAGLASRVVLLIREESGHLVEVTS